MNGYKVVETKDNKRVRVYLEEPYIKYLVVDDSTLDIIKATDNYLDYSLYIKYNIL